MELESSLVASQNALAVNPALREAQNDPRQRQQEQQSQASTELPPQQVVLRQPSAQAFEQAERFSQQQQQAAYDQPNGRNRAAINAYQSLATEQQRSDLHNLLGVDTYA